MKSIYKESVGSMPLQLLEIGFHVEIHAIEWHDFQRETHIYGVVVACIEFSQEGKKIKGGSHDLCCVEYIYGRRETERSLNKE